MEMMNTFFDFAENDFQFFQDAYEHGIKGSPMTAMGQNICERYLKHIINEYAHPESPEEENDKTKILKTHSISRLVNYIKHEMNLEIPRNVEIDARSVDGFYFSTRYPGEDCFVPTEDDIDIAYEATKTVRSYTLEKIQELDQSLFREPTEEDLEEFRHDEPEQDKFVMVDGMRSEDIEDPAADSDASDQREDMDHDNDDRDEEDIGDLD